VGALLVATASIAASCASGSANGGATATATAPVSAFPSPGTLVASPNTEIGFRGAPRDKIGLITVTGSASGTHRGRLVAHSDGRGASFVPVKPFAPGERVTVTTRLRLQLAPRGRFSFRVARPVADVPFTTPTVDAPDKLTTFRSRPDLQLSSITITKQTAASTNGDVFVAPRRGAGQDGLEILDSSGEVVWFQQTPTGQGATDFRKQTYQGNPVLTWWQGSLAKGHGYGVGIIEDTSYHRLATVRAGNGYQSDLHDFTVTPKGTALITAYRPVRWDLSSVGGSTKGVAFDSIVQEVDIKTGHVLFEWHSLGNVPLADSYAKPATDTPFDYFHVNSVDSDAAGDLLVSGRGTHTVYEIDRNTGRIHWRLGGKHSDFSLGAKVPFHSQHDARWLNANTMSIFDNGAGVGPDNHASSRGIVIHVDRKKRRADLDAEFIQPDGKLFSSQGDVQRLPGGGYFVGWGEGPFATEFSANGAVVFALQFTTGQSYRAYRFGWIGRPTSPPDAVATQSAGTTTVYASWNGATRVDRWEILGGPTAQQLTPIATAARTGFETAVTVSASPVVIEVRALDRNGAELGISKPVTPSAG
jgi:Arylsulfotransferase (ASST)